jgi:predicted peroxiredoxin
MKVDLGICVATRDSLEHVLGLSRAARNAGKRTDIFFTGDGVHETQDARFAQLLELGVRVGVCEVSLLARGYTARDVPMLRDKDLVTQGRNAEMVEESKRYLIL